MADTPHGHGADHDPEMSADVPLAAPTVPTAPPARRRRLLALWGVLAVLAVGVGTLAVTSGDDDPPRLPIALGSGSAGGAAERSASPAAADMSMLAWMHYVAGDDLPVLGGDGAVYRIDGEIDADAFRDLAEALGVEGDPEERDGSWHVEDDDGVLEAYEGGGGNWWYSVTIDEPRDVSGETRTAAGSSGSGSGEACLGDEAKLCETPAVDDVEPPVACEAIERLAEGEAVSSCDPEPFVPPADLPEQDEAREIALDLFRGMGVDVDDAKVTVDGPYDSWYVNIEPRLDGVLVSGLSYSAAIGPKGEITSAGGVLNTPERVGDYDVIDTRAAIDRLNEQSGGFGTSRSAVTDVADVDVAQDDVAVEGTTGGTDGASGDDVATPPPVECTSEPAIVLDDPVDPDTPVGSDDPSVGGGSDPAVGTGGSVGSDVLVDPMCATDPALPPVDPQPIEVTLHQAERILVLVSSYEPGGEAYLVPGYRMRGDDEAQVDVAAVADESLLPQPPQDDPIPVDLGGGIGDGGGTTGSGSTQKCAAPEPGPDGAVPEICLDPNSVPPAEPDPAVDVAPPVGEG